MMLLYFSEVARLHEYFSVEAGQRASSQNAYMLASDGNFYNSV